MQWHYIVQDMTGYDTLSILKSEVVEQTERTGQTAQKHTGSICS